MRPAFALAGMKHEATIARDRFDGRARHKGVQPAVHLLCYAFYPAMPLIGSAQRVL